MTDDKREPEPAMERFEEFARKVFSKTKDDLKKAEERAQEVVDDALGPPPAQGPAIADEGED